MIIRLLQHKDKLAMHDSGSWLSPEVKQRFERAVG
jgi:hypothetical protein